MLQDIDLRQLRALQAVAVEGSFGKAAERLGFTQSAISQQIASLERAVGERVFDRPGGPRRVELTPVGQVMLKTATTMLAHLVETEDALASLRAGEVGRLLVGSFQSVSVNLLPDVIHQLRIERPGLTVRCTESDENEELVARLLADELDLTFVVGLDDHPDLRIVQLMTDPFVLLRSSDDLAPDGLAGLVDGVQMIGQSTCACQTLIDDSLRRAGVEPDYVFRTNDNSAVQAMVRAGMGRAILPFLGVDHHDPGIVISSLDPVLDPRRIGIARRRGRTLIPAAERFIELAGVVAARLPRFEPSMA